MSVGRTTGAWVAVGCWLWVLVGTGCAWFQDPPSPSPPGAPPERTALAQLATRDTTQTTEETAAREARADSLRQEFLAAADSAARTQAAPDTGVAPDTAAIPEEAVSGPDQWDLDGENLRSVDRGGAQVIEIDRPVITQKDLRITALAGTYEVEQEVAHLKGNVTFTDPETRGLSETATYYRLSQRLVALGGVRIETDTLVVGSDRGVYDRESGIITLSGNVDGYRGRRHLVSEQARWYRERGEVVLTGGVVVADPEDETILAGEEIVYDLETDLAHVTVAPKLNLRSGDGRLAVTGNHMWVDPDGSSRVAGTVRVVRGAVVATSDSAAFFRSEQRAVLHGTPRVVERDGTLTGDTLTMFFDDDLGVELLTVHGHANVRFAPQDTVKQGEVSTVTGDSLTMFFDELGADRVVVFGNAESTYRPAPSDPSSGSGTNVVQGDSITIFLDEGQVSRVWVVGNAHGVYAFIQKEGVDEPEQEPEDGLRPGPQQLGPDEDALEGFGLGPEEIEEITAATTPGGRDSASALRDTTTADLERPGEAQPSDQKVIYRAHEVEYTLRERTVDLRKDVTLDYGVLTLTAGKVRFYADRRYLDAEEDPVLVEKGAGAERTVVGERMDYNLESNEGSISYGRTQAEDGFIYADRLRQTDDREFIARSGNFTTCDLADQGEDPHFHFTSKRMRIYLDDKVVAKPVTLYIRDIPILAIPFYVFSVRKGRHSGFLTPDFSFGIGGTRRFFRNLGYYWAASEYIDFALSVDYADSDPQIGTPSQFAGRLQTAYAVRYLMDGTLNMATTLGSQTSSFDVVGAHKMTLGNWRLTGRAEFRDPDFRRNQPLTTDFGSRLDRQLKSDLSLSRSFPFGASFSLAFRRVKDLDSPDLLETLPSYNFSLNSRTLGREPDQNGEGGRWPALATLRFSFSSVGSSTRLVQEQIEFNASDTTGAIDTTVVVLRDRDSEARHRFSLTDVRKLGFLNISPSFNLTEAWVDREFTPTDTVKGFRRAATWSASLGLNTILYGSSVGGVGPVESLRHTFRPTASFTYQPEFPGLTYTDENGVQRNRYPGVSASEAKVLNLGIRNNFQAKVRSAEETKQVQLFDWTLGASHNFVLAEQGLRGWSDISSVVDLPRILGLGFNFTSSHDPYNQFRFNNFTLGGSYRLSGRLPGGESRQATPGEETTEGPEGGESEGFDWEELGAGTGISGTLARGAQGPSRDDLGWNLGLTFSYTGNRLPDDFPTRASINFNLGVQITKNWSVDYYNRWDITNNDFLGERLSLRRELHCWEASFNRSQLGNDTTFWFQINIKQMSDIKYEQGQRGGTGLSDLTGFLP